MTYPGGKGGSGVYHAIINLMPPHQTYIEPFLGGGSIMRLKRPASLNIGVDLDPAVLPAGSPDSTIAAATARSCDARRRRSPDSTVEAFNARSGVEVRNAENSDGRHRFEFLHGDGIQFLDAYPWTGQELIYCDPPYLLNMRVKKKLYQFEMDEEDHRRLLRAIRRISGKHPGVKVMISGYSSVLYAQELKPWNAASFAATTRGGTLRAEFLWYNFNRPVELHDYRYLGTDYREREAIQRQKRRWVKRLEKMPILRRQALLSAIAETAASGDGGSARQLWR